MCNVRINGFWEVGLEIAQLLPIISCQQWLHHDIQHPNDGKEVQYDLKSSVKRVESIVFE